MNGTRTPDDPYMKGFGSASGTDFREAVEQASDEIDDDFEKRQRELFGNQARE